MIHLIQVIHNTQNIKRGKENIKPPYHRSLIITLYNSVDTTTSSKYTPEYRATIRLFHLIIREAPPTTKAEFPPSSYQSPRIHTNGSKTPYLSLIRTNITSFYAPTRYPYLCPCSPIHNIKMSGSILHVIAIFPTLVVQQLRTRSLFFLNKENTLPASLSLVQ